MKKVLKLVGGIIAGLIVAVAFFVLVCVISQKNAREKDRELLAADGLCNLTDAGDIQLNVPIFGAEQPRYTIVALPGSGDSSFSAAMKLFSEKLSGQDRLVVVDRPGYGISDVSKQDITTEYVVETTRTALKNAGIEGPYVLMPHSLGGMYAVYWENTYPEEVAAMFLLDTSFEMEDVMPEQEDSFANLMADLGVFRMLTGEVESAMYMMMPEAGKADAAALERYQNWGLNRSQSNEYNHVVENWQTSLASIQKNDIPKCYVYTDPESKSDMRESLEFQMQGLDVTDELVDQQFSVYDADYQQRRADYLNRLGNCELVHLPASHFLYLHRPEALAQELERFLEKLD